MRITIVKPGLLSTVQDLGRYHYLPQAVPISGAMDTLSARIANKAVGNPDDAAVIEFTQAGAEFTADTDLLIAYAGGGAILSANDQKLPAGRPCFIPAGTLVKLINDEAGIRTYIAVAAGWDVPEVLGSRSTFLTAGFGGLQGRPLKAGDVLSGCKTLSVINNRILNRLKGDKIQYANWSIERRAFFEATDKIIRVIPGHELGWFTGSSIAGFLSTPYAIAQRSNRMGYHLEGEAIHRTKNNELLSTAVMPGTIQVTGNGSMILLMADCQTTGGYPRIAQVAAVDLPLCAQLKPGDIIYFNAISRHDAEMLYIEREHDLQQLTIAIQSKFY